MTDQGEDELRHGADRSPWSPRVRVAFGLVVAAGAVALLVTLVRREPDHAPTAGTSVSITVPRDHTFTAPVVTLPPPASLPPGRCRETCLTTTAVPTPVRAAVDAAFPGAGTVQVVSTYDSHRVLVDRRVVADGGDPVVRVLLTRRRPQPALRQHSTAQGHDVRRFRVSLGANTVDVAAERLAGRTSEPAALDRLARDPRLRSSG